MISAPLNLAPRCGFGTKVPQPMASLGGHEGPVVLLEREDGPAKLAGQSANQKLRNPLLGAPFEGRDL